MPNFKVSYEIEVVADSPLKAALIVNAILDDRDPNAYGRQFYVQEENTKQIFSADLDEEKIENAISLVENYKPFIN